MSSDRITLSQGKQIAEATSNKLSKPQGSFKLINKKKNNKKQQKINRGQKAKYIKATHKQKQRVKEIYSNPFSTFFLSFSFLRLFHFVKSFFCTKQKEDIEKMSINQLYEFLIERGQMRRKQRKLSQPSLVEQASLTSRQMTLK